LSQLKDDERNIFAAIRNSQYENFALMRGFFHDKEVSFIVAINESSHKIKNKDGQENEYKITPVAILLNADLEKFCKCSDKKPLES